MYRTGSIRRAICALLLGAAAMLSSCAGDAAAAHDVPTRQGVRVGFRLSLGETEGYGTRSGAVDDGTSVDYENYIDLIRSNYRILFFDTDDRYLTAFRPAEFVPVGGDPLRTPYYEVFGEIDALVAGADFKVVVLANWPNYPDDAVAGETTIEEICTSVGSRYDYEPPFVPSADAAIPMYGVRRCTGMAFSADRMTWLGTVYLLRAMAKIEVVCPTEGWTLERVALHRYNRMGFCAPDKVYDEVDYVSDGEYEHPRTADIHPVEGAAAEGPLDFGRTDDGRFVICVPEYRNTLGGVRSADAAEIRVKFEQRKDKEYVIDFKYYQHPPEGSRVGDWFDIRRNYYYKFSITKSTEYDEPQISIDLYPYDVRELGPIFGQDK